MEDSKTLVEELTNIKEEAKKFNKISILNWNVCVKMKNTDELDLVFRKMKQKGCLPDVFVTQESVKRFDKNADKDYDTFEFLEKYYKKVIFSPTFSTRFFENKDGGLFNVGGEVAQGQLTATDFEVLKSFDSFFVGKFEKFYEDVSEEGIINEPRLYQSTILKLKNGGCVQIVNLHGCWNKNKTGGRDSTMMIRKLIKDFKDSEFPTIILGDFNLIPNSQEIQEMSKYFKNLNDYLNIKATRPIFQDGVDNLTSNDPQMTVDYVFVNGKVKLDSCNIFVDRTNLVSDHFPMVFSFDCETVLYNKKDKNLERGI